MKQWIEGAALLFASREKTEYISAATVDAFPLLIKNRFFFLFSTRQFSPLDSILVHVKGTFTTELIYEFLGVFLLVIQNPARVQCSASKTFQSSMFPWKLEILELARHGQ